MLDFLGNNCFKAAKVVLFLCREVLCLDFVVLPAGLSFLDCSIFFLVFQVYFTCSSSLQILSLSVLFDHGLTSLISAYSSAFFCANILSDWIISSGICAPFSMKILIRIVSFTGFQMDVVQGEGGLRKMYLNQASTDLSNCVK